MKNQLDIDARKYEQRCKKTVMPLNLVGIRLKRIQVNTKVFKRIQANPIKYLMRITIIMKMKMKMKMKMIMIMVIKGSELHSPHPFGFKNDVAFETTAKIMGLICLCGVKIAEKNINFYPLDYQ